MLTWNDIKPLLWSLLRWWWLIILASGLAAGTAFLLSAGETRFYVARTSLMVGNTLGSTVPDPNQLGLSSSLARAYGELARREPILKPVVQSLQLQIPWQLLSDEMLQTNVIPSANLLEMYVTDSNPDRAAAIANAIGEQLIIYSPASPEKLAAEQQAIGQQLQESDKRIRELKAKIDELTVQRDRATSASDLTEINRQLDELDRTLGNEQTVYRNLLNYKTTSTVNSLSFFERAVPPAQPLPSKRLVTVAVAGAAGLLLAFAAIFFLEQIDPRWRGVWELKHRFLLETLGIVPSGPPIIAAEHDFAQRRERAIRDAHTNILLSAKDGKLRSLLITSPSPSDDRSAFAIDLAYIFARSGHRVLLVDADLSNPHLTRLLLPDHADPASNGGANGRHDIWTYLRPTVMPNVMLLPSSLNGPGVAAFVPSMRWGEIVQQMLGLADIVIFDGPSVLASADAALLAAHMDGAVLTVSTTSDSKKDIEQSKQRLRHRPASRLLGAVTFTPAVGSEGQPLSHRLLTAARLLSLPPGTQSSSQSRDSGMVDKEVVIITPPPEDAVIAGSPVDAAIDDMSVVDDVASDNTPILHPLVRQTASQDTRSTRRSRRRRHGRSVTP